MITRLLSTMFFTALCVHANASDENESHDLIGNMGALQYFSHKLDLAIRHENLELAGFYAHELEETIEATTAIEAYHDHPVGALAESMLVPAFERLEQTLETEPVDSESLNRAFDTYIATCNACHETTGYGFIRIERTDTNPFMQSFEPGDASR